MNFARGEPPNDSFIYCQKSDIPVQYQDANHAWRTVVDIATHLGISVEADVEWEKSRPGKTTPAFPGKRGRLVIRP